MARFVLLLGLLAACGRFDFDALGDGGGGGGDAVADARDPPPFDAASCAATYNLMPPALTSRYRYSSTGASWFAAEANCEGDGGHLVVINSGDENAFARMQIGFPTAVEAVAWIGLTDHVQEGTFRWVTGVAPGFTNWATAEPSNSFGAEDCVDFSSAGLWDDVGCKAATITYLCECDGATLPAVPAYCDTETMAACGQCGTACGASQTCTNQVCVP